MTNCETNYWRRVGISRARARVRYVIRYETHVYPSIAQTFCADVDSQCETHAGMNLPISAWYTSRRPSATSPFLWLSFTGKPEREKRERERSSSSSLALALLYVQKANKEETIVRAARSDHLIPDGLKIEKESSPL